MPLQSLAMVPEPGLLFGLMLVAAIVGGYAARWLRVPRVVGFLVGGVVLRMVLYTLLDEANDDTTARRLEAAVSPLAVVKDLALGLFLFTIGGVFERSRMRASGDHVSKISLVESGAVTLMVFGGCLIVAWLTQSGTSLGQSAVLAILLATAAIATAPAATLFVLQEYEAKGSTTNTVLGLTGLNNIICIVAFHALFLVLAACGGIATHGALAENIVSALLLTTVGSVALGIAAGTVISVLHAKLPLAETLLFFFALFIILGAGEQWLWDHQGLSYSFLLTSLTMGAVFANIGIDAQRLESALRTFGAPLYAGFFVMAGFGLQLGDLATMGWLGAAYIVCRSAGKIIGCSWGQRWAHRQHRPAERLGAALLCQAAVVIGLATFVERQWDSPLAKQFSTVILGSVVVFELIGPLLLKRTVVMAGEVKAVTLLHRPGVTTEGASVTRIILESLGRVIGLGGRRPAPKSGAMLVKHIMRANVHVIPASSTFDETLHAIERSTYSHFPVVHDDGSLAGVIHFSDVRDVMYDPSLTALVTAADLADPDSPTVPVDMPLERLLELFNRENLAVVPVVAGPGERRIVGIVEQRDLLRALHVSQEPK